MQHVKLPCAAKWPGARIAAATMASPPLRSLMDFFSFKKAAPFGHKTDLPRRAPCVPRAIIQATQSMERSSDKVYKELVHQIFENAVVHRRTFAENHGGLPNRSQELWRSQGLFSLRKKMEDAASHVEMIASIALELEEARRLKQEQILREIDLWADLDRSNESLSLIADATKRVNDLKDLQYKAEEVKLIAQLSETDIINYQLLKQAYEDSVQVSNFLCHYEMSKLLTGPYDKEGACVFIEAGPEGITSELWAEKLLVMYIKWAEKHGCKGRITEKYISNGGGLKSATVEFESEYFYGFLSGEEGIHKMIQSSLDGFTVREVSSASINVIPLFSESASDLDIDKKDLEVSSPIVCQKQNGGVVEPSVRMLHIPSGLTTQCSGERSYFANSIKALNHLKAKLLVAALQEGAMDFSRIRRGIADKWRHETRKYMSHQHKMVEDLKTGLQLHDLNSVLDGNIEPFIKAHICLRKGREME